MENLINRQEDLNLNIPKSTCVIGAGGVGTWVTIFLAQVGVQEIHVFDDDIIELHNLNRLPYSKGSVGKKKVNALKEFIASFSESTVFPYPVKFDESHALLLLNKPDVLFECSDDYTTQKFSCQLCRESGIPFIRLGTNAFHITITDTLPEWGEAQGGECGVVIPQWIAPQVIVAGFGLVKALSNKGNLFGDVRKIGGKNE